MDYRQIETKEGVRESLIAISYNVFEDISYVPETETANGVTVDSIADTRNKSIDELRLQLISLASSEPSTGHKSDKSTAH